MPPITRSASRAPITPQKVLENLSFASPGGRRRPHCQTCNKPRKGHPRQGCPEYPPLGNAQGATLVDVNLADALNSLKLDSEAEDAGEHSPLSAGKNPSRKARPRREEGSPAAVTSRSPVGLIIAELPRHRAESEVLDHHDEIPKPVTQPSAFVHSPIALPSRRSIRSTSISAREEFLDSLDRVSTRAPVSVYAVPTDHIGQLRPFAKEIGFYMATVTPEGDPRSGETLLVLGTESAAVEDVCERIMMEDAAMAQRGGSHCLAQVAGGAVVGAAAIFAGLSL
ncbi:unnamed protein product [Peniophora sp. CBMAI 1063]|nr:unnamed protein product [Peniophora sp. CBMAI 1063]